MKGKSLSAFLLALPVATGGLFASCAKNTEASAASAYGRTAGVNGSEIVVDCGGAECPIAVADETLTFYIDDLPLTKEEAEHSTSRVEARYTLENPTAEDITLTVFFPVGFVPDYLAALDDDRYSVTAEDGTQVGLTKRYTYHERGYYGTAFDLDGELPRSDFNEETFFRKDTPVTEYTYTVTVPQSAEGSVFTFRFDANLSRTKVFSSGGGAMGINNGMGEVYRNVQPGQTQQIVVYAIGEEPRKTDAGIYSMSGASAQLIAEAGKPQEREGLTFGALVQELYAETDGSVGYRDFYNATVAMLTEDSDLRFSSRFDAEAVLDSLMLWYEYELTVPQNGSVVSTVTSPLMPDLPSESSGRWTFEYLLSPGQQWADFGSITINVETEFCLESASLQFTETETGYTYTKEGLPLGELSLVVMRKEGMGYDPQPVDGGTSTLTTALILLGVALGISAAVIIVVLCVRAHNNKKMRAEEERLNRGKTEEGKIDLDPFPEANPDAPEHQGGDDRRDGGDV